MAPWPASRSRTKIPFASGFSEPSSTESFESSTGGSCLGSPTATSARHPKRDIASMLDGSVICEHSSSTTTSKVMPSSAALPHDAVVVPTTRTLERALARLSAAPAFVAASSAASSRRSASVFASFNISMSSPA